MTYHVPVLAGTVRAWAAGGRRAVDATVGGGGHAALLLEGGALVLALDRDLAAVAAARARLGDARVEYLVAPFASPQALAAVARFGPDRVFMDLGVSSHQIDTPERGFSFRPGTPLDMRMAPNRGATAADLLNTWSAAEVAEVLAEYADLRRARPLAREVVRRRARAPFASSDDLVNAIRATLGSRAGPADFARVFQALRIAVNAELDELRTALPALLEALQPEGRIGVITYHSGEDRIVKHLFREWSRACVCPPRQPVCTCRGRALGRVLTRKGARPAPGEVADNPRARSARFRAFEKA